MKTRIINHRRFKMIENSDDRQILERKGREYFYYKENKDLFKLPKKN